MAKKYGQFFTKNIDLQNKIYSFILNKPNLILEPSVGRGDLVKFIEEQIDVKFDTYEIDNKINFIIDKTNIIFGDFLKQKINIKYDTIIGNPPYVKTTKGNLYIDFINKCFGLLKNKGELIFIVPSDFLKLTSASCLLNKMTKAGYFSHIYHPHKENLFDNASIDIIIFRYCKNQKKIKKTLYNDVLMYQNNSNGLITFTKQINTNTKLISDYFNVYVGLVSGKEHVYKHDLGNIRVLNKENKKVKYIMIKSYPSEDKKINKYLLKHKDILIKRKIRKFNDTNWFEWGAPRNINVMEKDKNKKCIYVKNLTRDTQIAFLGKIDYFCSNLLMLNPTCDIDLDKIIIYLNSDMFKHNFIYSGRFKIGQRQLKNSYLTSSDIL